jgi:transposase
MQDVRRLQGRALEDLRRRVVGAVTTGVSQAEASRVFGVSRPTVNKWVQAYQESGDDSFQPRKRGRPAGERWPLTVTQEAEIMTHISGSYPDTVGLQYPLWTKSALGELVFRLFGMQLSLPVISAYLRRWGFTAPTPLPHAQQRSPLAMRHWRSTRYPVIARAARVERATIFWMTWMSLHYTTPIGERGKKVSASKGSGKELWEVNILSAMSCGGALFFSAHQGGPCDGELFGEFLRRLSNQTQRRIHVVVDLMSISRSTLLYAWLNNNSARVSAHFPIAGGLQEGEST